MTSSRRACLATLLLFATAPITRRVAGAQSELVIVKPSAAEKQYHRAGCAAIKDSKDVLAMTRAEAESRGYGAHAGCDPSRMPAQPPGSTSSPNDAAKKVPIPTVFVDGDAKYYHRKDCSKLGKDAKPVALNAVGKRWPCTTCRPPVLKRSTDPLVPGWRG